MKTAKSLLALSFGLIGSAIVVTNAFLVYLTLFPLFVLLLGVLLEPPSGVLVSIETNKKTISLNDEVTVKVRLRVTRGIGRVLINVSLPPEVILSEGSNVRVFFKGFGMLEREFYLKLRFPKKGSYTINPFEVRTLHILRIVKGSYAVSNTVEIQVLPEIRPPKRLRIPLRKTKLLQLPMSLSIRGERTIDFREIREYYPGDPFKFINWKATARFGKPLVNEYEREGRKTLMFFIDATPAMSVGRLIGAPLDQAAGLVASLTQYLLRKNYRVGLYIIGPGTMIPPQGGSDQSYRIVKTLVSAPEGLKEDYITALNRAKMILRRFKPIIVFVTNITENNYFSIQKGVSTLGKIYGSRPPLILVDMFPYSVFRDDSVELIRLEKLAMGKKLSRFVPVFSWDSEEKSLPKLLGEISMVVR